MKNSMKIYTCKLFDYGAEIDSYSERIYFMSYSEWFKFTGLEELSPVNCLKDGYKGKRYIKHYIDGIEVDITGTNLI